MKTLIIYQSFHHHNTEKIVKYLAENFPIDLLKISEATADMVKDYDQIVFATGIYFGKPHRLFYEIIPKLKFQNQKILIITTSGMPSFPFINNYHRNFKSLLKHSDLIVKSWFDVRGFDSYPFFVRPFGGINKTRPNQKDLKNALEWFKSLE